MDDTLNGMSRRSKWLLGLLTPCVLVLGGGVWLTSTTSGLQWLSGVIENNTGKLFTATGISGNLRDAFTMQRIILHGEGWRVELHDVQMQWQPSRLLLGQLDVITLDVRQVDILTRPTGKAAVMPESISLPVALNVSKLNIGTLRMFSREGAAPDFVAGAIEMRLSSDAQKHHVLLRHAKIPYGDIAGAAEIALQKPYALTANAALAAPLLLGKQVETLRFTADANGDLQALAVRLHGSGGSLNMAATAGLTPYAETGLQALHADIGGVDADWLFADGHKAMFSATVDLHGKKDGVIAGGMTLRNASPALAFDLKGIPVTAVETGLLLSAGQLQMDAFEARLAHAGRVTGALDWHLHTRKGSARFRLLDVDPAALYSRLPDARLQGEITLQGSDTEQHVVLALTDGKVQLNGELTHQGTQVEVFSLRLARGDTELSGNGHLALEGRRKFNFSSRLSKLNLAEFSTSPRTDLNASLDVAGTLLPQAAGELHFALADSRFAQYDVGGKGHLTLAGTGQVAAAIEARLGDNRLDLQAAYGSAADFLRMTLDAPRLDQLGSGLGGQLTGRAGLGGSAEHPVLDFSLSGKKLQLPAGQFIEQAEATGDLQESALKLQLGVSGYRATPALTIPLARLELQGSRAQHHITASAQALQGNEALGTLTLEANGGFNETWRDVQTLRWQGTLDKLEASGIVPFRLQAAVSLQAGKNLLQLGEAEFASGAGKVTFLESLWTPQGWRSAGSFSGMGVQAVNSSRKPALLQRMESMRFAGAWDVSGNDHLQGDVSVQRESGDWMLDEQSGVQMGLHKLQLSLKADRDYLHTRFEAAGERLGEIVAEAGLPLTRSDTGWSVTPDAPVGGHVHVDAQDFSWVGPLLDDSLQTGGALIVDADIEGSLFVPRLQGVALGDGLSLALLDQGVRLEQGKLYLLFDRDAVHVEQLSFVAPFLPKPKDKRLDEYSLPGDAGSLTASGMLDLRGLNGDLQITAEHLPLSQREDRWVIASGGGRIRYADKVLMLDGHISADAGLIDQPVNDRPRWSDDLNIVGQEVEVHSARQSRVRATLDLGEQFFIRASGLEGRLEGTLDVRGEPGQALIVTGIIEAQEAIFDAYGQRLQVERGMVNFQGQFDDPGLNILALRKGLSVEAGVEVGGTARHPVIQLVSTPNVPDAEKLSWIILGRVPDSTGLDTSLLLAAAGNIMGGQSTGQIGRALGVDELSMHQSGTGDALQSQVVTVGKRLTARAYLSYEHGFADPAGVTKFSYILTPRVTLVTRTGTEDAMDIFYSFRFH